MHIFIITQWFPPEHAPIGQMMLELGSGLVEFGHKVTIFTGFPNHPYGRILGGYKKRLCQKEQINGVDVHRTWLYTSSKRTFLRRILTSLTFIFMTFWAALFRGRCDAIIAVLQPLTVGIVIPFLAKIKGAKTIFNLQDIHPDALSEIGIVRNKTAINLLRRLEYFSYKHSDRIAVICESFKKHIISKGILSDKVAIIENWVNPYEIKPGNRMNKFREKFYISENSFVVLYSGTVGYVSGVNIILSAAEILRNENDLLFVIVGDGPVLPALKKETEHKKITSIRFIPFQERSLLNDILSSADIALVTMQKSKGRFSMPSKVLAYMAAGRPIIASVDTGSPTAEQIKKSRSGIVVPAEDSDSIADAILHLRKFPESCLDFGRNGRLYIEKYLNAASAVEKYEALLKCVVEKKC